MARFSDSHWHNSSTVTGTFVQQWFARFFNSHSHNSSTLSSTIYQQWPAQFFNGHGQDFFFFLCWQNFSTVMFTVERIFFLKKNFFYKDLELFSQMQNHSFGRHFLCAKKSFYTFLILIFMLSSF